MNPRLNMKRSIRYLLILLALPLALVADVYYITSGELTSITRTQVVAGDMEYRLSPTVKVYLTNGELGGIEQLAIGDDIALKILSLNNRDLVDSIFLLPNHQE